MKARTVFWCCLTAASLAFYLGTISGALAVTQNDHPITPPPAGDQFNDGPVLVRLPGAHLPTTRYIF